MVSVILCNLVAVSYHSPSGCDIEEESFRLV